MVRQILAVAAVSLLASSFTQAAVIVVPGSQCGISLQRPMTPVHFSKSPNGIAWTAPDSTYANGIICPIPITGAVFPKWDVTVHVTDNTDGVNLTCAFDVVPLAGNGFTTVKSASTTGNSSLGVTLTIPQVTSPAGEVYANLYCSFPAGTSSGGTPYTFYLSNISVNNHQ